MSSLKKFDYRIKDNRKRNIFLCGIILVIVTIVGVKLFNSYATFSNETTTIDLANGNVVIPATHYLKELEKTNKNQLVYDGTTDNNLRYIGKDPDNYVEFNGELWRIIGVMNNIENETGKKESRIKLIRNEGLDNNIIFEWDGKQNIGSATTTYGSNDWTDSQLMMMLNPVDVIKKDWSKQETKQLYLIDETSKEVKDINQKVFYKEIGSYFNRINGFKPYDTGSDGKSPYLTDIDFTNLGLP